MGLITRFLDNHLIADWRKALRLRIIQLHLAITAIGAAIYNMAKQYPDAANQIVAKLPPELLNPVFVNLGLLAWLILGLYARLSPQPSVTAPAPQPAPPGA
jgi:hypothetical protein